MFVGEQPGDQEDLQGRPFVGPAGQLFDRALAELGIDRRDAYVTNAVKHFKFELRGKRRIHKTPAQEEAAACLHWLESEIALVDPAALVALGATAARQLMGRAIGVTRERGQWLRRADGRRVLITLHPSALLRMEPEDKAAAWAAWLADLRKAAAILSGGGTVRKTPPARLPLVAAGREPVLFPPEHPMRTFAATLICASLSFASASAFAASHMEKEKGASAPMAKGGTMKKEMSMQECKDHMAMAKKDTMAKKDDAMMKKDAACAEMMKKDEMMKKESGMTKKEEPMKK